MKIKTVTHKVLPFTTKQGEVPGHEVAKCCPEWLGEDTVQSVAFSRFDKACDMTVEVHIHWTKVTQYLKRSWPDCGEVKAVITVTGRRIHATSFSAAHHDEAAYKAAPILCRDTFKITTLDRGNTLWYVVGVDGWLWSKRDAAATEKFMACPWGRDNAAYAAQQAETL